MPQYRPGEMVRWTSSNTTKEGVVEAVVPAGAMPKDVGFPQVGVGSLSRSHESYVVRGGEPGRRKSVYWPVVSLLSPMDGLSPVEIAWCNAHPAEIRALIAASGKTDA